MSLNEFNALELMIGNMYGEARMVEGDLIDDVREYIAIGNVVMNRVKDKRWPDTVKEVILQWKQFSWTNAGDPSRQAVINFLKSESNTKRYRRLEAYAEKILEGKTVDLSLGSCFYVAEWYYIKEKKQKWIDEKVIAAAYGGHIFLRDA